MFVVLWACRNCIATWFSNKPEFSFWNQAIVVARPDRPNGQKYARTAQALTMVIQQRTSIHHTQHTGACEWHQYSQVL